MDRKAQVTIFIIVAIIIVAAILVFFIAKGKIQLPDFRTGMPNVQNDMEKCIKDSVNNAISLISEQGGIINPTLYIDYKGNKVTYLCYSAGFYTACKSQYPLFVQKIENEINYYIKPKIEDCFYGLEQEYQEKNYNVEFSPSKVNVELKENFVEILIDKKIEISKNEENKKYEKFVFRFNTGLYNLAVLASEIANQESIYCYFEYLGYMLMHPEVKIEKIDIQGHTKIYTLSNKNKLVFAVRSCAIPAGF